MANRRTQRGQAIIMMSISTVVIFGLLGLVVDIGWANWRKEAAKTACEAAAQAAVAAAKAGGVSNYNVVASTSCGSNPTNSTPLGAGCLYAKQNGFTDGASNRTVSYQAGTTSGMPSTVSGIATTYWVSYTATEDIWTTFSAILGKTRTSVAARATAAIPGSAASTPGCIYVLDPSASEAFLADNNAHVTSACGIYVNSSASTGNGAMHVWGSANVTVNGGNGINVVGSYKTDNAGVISPTPTTAATFPGDPFSSLPAPTVAGTCQPGNFTAWQATPYTPAPGTYCTFQVGNGMNTQLSAGTYVINGGSFSVQGGSTLSTTGGVLIYLTGGAYINIANGTTVRLSPQTSGTYQGVLFYQDRTMTSPTGSDIAGGSNSDLQGSIYLPHSLLTIDNGTKTNIMALVVGKVFFAGGTQVINAATSTSQTGIGGATTPYVALIE